MQFVDILNKMKKKHDDNENMRTLMNNLQKIKIILKKLLKD